MRDGDRRLRVDARPSCEGEARRPVDARGLRRASGERLDSRPLDPSSLTLNSNTNRRLNPLSAVFELHLSAWPTLNKSNRVLPRGTAQNKANAQQLSNLFSRSYDGWQRFEQIH